jgi:nicotinamide-nucleotide amidase
VKNRLIFIGNIFIQNKAFRDYIIRTIETDGVALDSIEYYPEADRDFFGDLEKRLRDEEMLYILTSKKSFTLVGKLLCTILGDKLVLKEQMLIPSQCETYVDNSYRLDINASLINVIQVQESQEVPRLLITRPSSQQKLHFFETPIKKVIEVLKPLSKQYGVSLAFSQIIEGWVEVRVACNTFGSIEKFLQVTEERYPAKTIVSEDLVQHIIDAILAADRKITLAESCTGGLLAYCFTSHAGVSSVFEGSLVTYSNILKENWLAVDNATLIKHGAVSEEVVAEMCEGALNVAKADYALAISGVAGPDGGSIEKPVGTVVIGVKSENYENVVRCHFKGDRNYIQQQSALTALKMLILGDKKVFFKKF